VSVSLIYKSADVALPLSTSPSISYNTALSSHAFETRAAFTARVYLR